MNPCLFLSHKAKWHSCAWRYSKCSRSLRGLGRWLCGTNPIFKRHYVFIIKWQAQQQCKAWNSSAGGCKNAQLLQVSHKSTVWNSGFKICERHVEGERRHFGKWLRKLVVIVRCAYWFILCFRSFRSALGLLDSLRLRKRRDLCVCVCVCVWRGGERDRNHI